MFNCCCFFFFRTSMYFYKVTDFTTYLSQAQSEQIGKLCKLQKVLWGSCQRIYLLLYLIIFNDFYVIDCSSAHLLQNHLRTKVLFYVFISISAYCFIFYVFICYKFILRRIFCIFARTGWHKMQACFYDMFCLTITEHLLTETVVQRFSVIKLPRPATLLKKRL